MVWLVAVAFGAFTLGFLLAALLAGASSSDRGAAGAPGTRVGHSRPAPVPSGSSVTEPMRVAPSARAGEFASG